MGKPEHTDFGVGLCFKGQEKEFWCVSLQKHILPGVATMCKIFKKKKKEFYKTDDLGWGKS